MLFFKKKESMKEINEEGTTVVLNEILIHYDDESLNTSLTNLEVGPWKIKKEIHQEDTQTVASLSAFRTDALLNENKFTTSNIANLNNEVLSLELTGASEEFYVAELIIDEGTGVMKIYQNNADKVVGVSINLSGNISNGITDIGN